MQNDCWPNTNRFLLLLELEQEIDKLTIEDYPEEKWKCRVAGYETAIWAVKNILERKIAGR